MCHIKDNTFVRKKQTNIPKIRSIFLKKSIDKRKTVRYNSIYQTNVPNDTFDLNSAEDMDMNEYYYERATNHKYARTIAKRKGILYNRKAFMIILFLLIFAITFFSIRLLTYANDSVDDCSHKKQYKSIMIYCGDTVSSLAEDNIGYGYTKESLIREICAINNISSGSELIAGNYLIIPYYE